MFQRDEGPVGAGGGAVALRPAPARTGFNLGGLADIGRRVTAVDGGLVVDLGARIGSLHWFRGVLTCGALCIGAASLAPGFAPIAAPAPPGLTESQQEEAQPQALAPLAFGAGTGRRMVPTAAVHPLVDTPERPSLTLTATLGQGDGFARTLTRAGVGDDEAAAIADMVAGAVPLGDIAPGTVLDLTLGRRSDRRVARPVEVLAFRARFDMRLSLRRVAGRLVLERQPVAIDATPLRIAGRVGSGLYLAARAAGAPGSVIEAYLKAIAQQVSIGAIGADDRFDMIVAHRRAATGETQTGDLLYAGLRQRRRAIQMVRWDQDGRTQWFEASGVGEQRGEMRMPVDNSHVTSGFGMRMHPLLGFSRMHKGIDYGVPYGAPIMAATDGTVAYAGWHGGHGNYVLLKHAGNMMTGYAHMSRILAQVGARVLEGQVIGYVGSTGLSTGPHLHFEVYLNGVAVDPAKVRYTTVAQLAGADLVRFRARVAQLLAIRSGR